MANRILNTSKQISEALRCIIDQNIPVAFDYETNGLNPFLQDDPKVLTVAFSNDINMGYCFSFDHTNNWNELERDYIFEEWGKFLSSNVPKIIHNWQFEELYSRYIFKTEINNVIHDTMICAHILDETPGTKQLKWQVYKRWGHPYDEGLNVKNLQEEEFEKVAEYNCFDARYTLRLYQDQLKDMDKANKNAYSIFHPVIGVFADMMWKGVKVDEDTFNNYDKYLIKLVAETKEHINNSNGAKAYLEKYKEKVNPASTQQLQRIFYTIYDAEVHKRTAKGNISVDVETITALSSSSIKDVAKLATLIGKLRKLTKLKSTYVDGFRKNIDKNFIIHPSFALHKVRTYRSSSENPNFQNIPKRDPEGKKVRKFLVPKNDVFLACDFSGAEVRMMANYSKDKNLIKYLLEDYDMHKDFAAKLYKIPIDKVTKQQRNDAKGSFVFPEFYGSYYRTIANNLNLPEKHVQEVEALLWETFPGVKKWKEEQIEFYNRNGYVETLLGFRRYAPLSINKIINTPIQATAFHCLLVGVHYAFKEVKHLKSHIVAQVHDDVTIDTVESEIEEVIDIVERCLTKVHWDWQVVKMALGWEIGETLLDMQEI